MKKIITAFPFPAFAFILALAVSARFSPAPLGAATPVDIEALLQFEADALSSDTPLFPWLEDMDAVELESAAEIFRRADEKAEADPEEAIALYREGLAREPGALQARRELAGLYLDRGEHLEAAMHYRRLLDAEPVAENALSLSRAYAAAGAYREASWAAADGAEDYPDEERLVYKAALFSARAGLAASALPWLEEAASRGLYDRELRLARLVVALEEGAWDKAAGAFRTLVEAGEAGPAFETVSHLRENWPETGGMLVFPPAGWEVEPDGFLEPRSGSFLVLASAAGRAEAGELVAARLLEILPVPGREELEEAIAAGGNDVFRLERRETDSPSGTLVSVTGVPGEEGPYLPGFAAWHGPAAGGRLVAFLLTPPGEETIDFPGLCAALVADSFPLPEGGDTP